MVTVVDYSEESSDRYLCIRCVGRCKSNSALSSQLKYLKTHQTPKLS